MLQLINVEGFTMDEEPATVNQNQTPSPAPASTQMPGIQPSSPVNPMPTTPGTPPSATSTASPSSDYVSNPFLISVRGLIVTLKRNPVSSLLAGLVGLVLLLIAYLLFVALVSLLNVVIAVVLFIALSLAIVIPFASYYVIGSKSARDEEVSTSYALATATRKLPSIIALIILSILMMLAGFILLIIPGFYILGRISLAGLVLFEENVGPVQAIKRSMELTKGHVIEMLGAMFASNLLSGGGGYGLLAGPLWIAPLVGRYQDLRSLKESGATKPKVHWLNYLMVFVLPVLIAVVFIAALALGFMSGAKDAKNGTNTPFETTQPAPGGFDASTNDFYSQ